MLMTDKCLEKLDDFEKNSYNTNFHSFSYRVWEKQLGKSFTNNNNQLLLIIVGSSTNGFF